MKTTDITTRQSVDASEDVSRLASDADDRGAQLAFAIEGISDEIERVLRELANLRTLVAEQRSLLDELKARGKQRARNDEPPACTWRLIGS